MLPVGMVSRVSAEGSGICNSNKSRKASYLGTFKITLRKTRLDGASFD